MSTSRRSHQTTPPQTWNWRKVSSLRPHASALWQETFLMVKHTHILYIHTYAVHINTYIHVYMCIHSYIYIFKIKHYFLIHICWIKLFLGGGKKETILTWLRGNKIFIRFIQTWYIHDLEQSQLSQVSLQWSVTRRRIRETKTKSLYSS